MKKYFFVIILFVFVVSMAHTVYAVTDPTATTGFIPGQIWYSKYPLVEGDTVKIHTAVWNANTSSLYTRVDFYDKNVVLGTRDITVLPSRLEDISITWKVTSGDHSISAKIGSSTILNNGKKEQIILSNNTTLENNTFIPVSIKTINGQKVTSSDVVKNDIKQASFAIKDILPSSIDKPISSGFNSLDNFRDITYTNIIDAKDKTKKEIDILNDVARNSELTTIAKDKNTKILPKNEEVKSKSLYATDKPILYVKLFLLSVIDFIFGTKIIFYGLILFIVFLILRSIYRKISNR